MGSILEKVDVHAPIYSIDQVFDDPQVKHLEMAKRQILSFRKNRISQSTLN